ncbi:acidic mammalian chitinase [Gaeumannomyces tritici R3-111a-1]|uniref:chitinase n=1 Tax=Gaeumannomyces tritici (strain R3-111a-1) TaxID=644352 RepID=J3NW09_GAET3|nr:acidic mammalian chitinase [Gaeumannomyces tritici R3-111a-1]EJT75539.1 acidic mammalian chitinase [Gaeumannomyces tritici R3-111a-1]
MSFISISKTALAVLLAVGSVNACPSGTRHSNNNNINNTAAAVKPVGAAAVATSPEIVPPSGGGYSNGGGMHATTYFAGYHAKRSKAFTVEQMPWSKYTDVKYAFAETTANGTLDMHKSAPEELPKFVKAAHAAGVKAQLAIGGWSGSIHFGSNVGDAKNRTAFVKTCLDTVKQYDLDGLDFDWEYPGRQGLGCNAVGPNDTLNFMAFLQELRREQPKPLLLSAAVSLFPYNNKDGQRSANGELSKMAELLDYSIIVGYDIFGAWAGTGGPNAPLAFSCDSKRNNQGGIKEGIEAWVGAGYPKEKLVLGFGAYGHGFTVENKEAFGPDGALLAYPKNSGQRRQGSTWDDDPLVDDCGGAQPASGTFTVWSMVQEGKFLDEAGNPAPGIAHGFDNCSQTPFLYDNATQWWVSYDNAQSIKAKGGYLTSNKLAGFAMWEAGGDFKNLTVDAIRSAVGLPKA